MYCINLKDKMMMGMMHMMDSWAGFLVPKNRQFWDQTTRSLAAPLFFMDWSLL